MIKIDSLKDLDNPRIDERMEFYLRKRLSVLSQSLKTENLTCFGSIFLIEGISDVEELTEAGINSKPSDITFENVTKIHIFNSREEFNVLFGCVVLNNDYAVDIVCTEGICNKELEANMLLNVDCEEFLIFEQGV